MYEIEWQPKAYRQLKKIKERETLAAIKDAVCDLANWPHCRNVKAMKNHVSGYGLVSGVSCSKHRIASVLS